MHMQTTERASVCPDRKGFGHFMSAAAAQLRGPPWIDFNNLATSTPSLVAEHLYEAVPRGIMNMFRKMMIMNHSPDIELFNSDKDVFVSDSFALSNIYGFYQIGAKECKPQDLKLSYSPNQENQ